MRKMRKAYKENRRSKDIDKLKEKKKMTKNKTSAIIGTILVITIALTLFALPSVNAQAGVSKNTFAIVGALPNPVGIGQETLILAGITHAIAWPQVGWTDVTVTVTKPDGSTTTLGPVTTDTTGMTGIRFRSE